LSGKISNKTRRRNTPYSKFKAFMEENQIKQSQLADLLGKSKSCINQNLNGTGGDFSMSDIRKICNEYGISSDKYFICQKVS
jgi:transcriptional regulator with XRE-family HTH domain